MKTMEWDDIEPIIRKFYVWQNQPERPWFQKAWKSLHEAGLDTYDTDTDRHRVIIRGAALGVMYNDYCDLEWDEYSDPSSCVSELFWRQRLTIYESALWQPTDQDQHEWVVVLKGAARLSIEGEIKELKPGDCINIPAHQKHRVEWTTPDEPTICLVVFYGEETAT